MVQGTNLLCDKGGGMGGVNDMSEKFLTRFLGRGGSFWAPATSF